MRTDVQVFANAVAQHENLGDLVIRRTVIGWVAEAGPLHVFTGAMPADYVAGLDLPPGTTTYTSSRLWTRRLLAAGGDALLAFGPGEQRLELNRRELTHSAVNLALTGYLRARGSHAVKLGRGYRGDHPLLVRMEGWHKRLLDTTWHRDAQAFDVVPGGVLVPDVAMAADLDIPTATRSRVAVSTRYDRTGSADDIVRYAGVAASTLDAGLDVVTQVRMDRPGHADMARRNDAHHVDWDPAVPHSEQLATVLGAYAASRVVVSDRLHVLVFAARAGAVPVGVETGRHQKLVRHLEPLGLSELCTDVEGLPSLLETVCADLDGFGERVRSATAMARARIEASRVELVGLWSGRSAA